MIHDFNIPGDYPRELMRPFANDTGHTVDAPLNGYAYVKDKDGEVVKMFGDGQPRLAWSYRLEAQRYMISNNLGIMWPTLIDGWVSVEDTGFLPPPDLYDEFGCKMQYLVCASGLVQTVGCNRTEIEWVFTDNDDTADNVTHWRPFPLPPKETP